MPTPERPFDGKPPNGHGDASYEWLDEWLCEYVDGTMDPSLEVVFEEYVEANPELKAHVERLRQTRELLCGCDLPEKTSATTQADVCSEVEEDFLQGTSSFTASISRLPLAKLGVASSVTVALVVGFLAGSLFVHPATLSPTAPSQTVTQTGPVQDRVTPRLEGPAPALQYEVPSFSVGEAFPRRAAGPDAAPDTAAGASTFTTVDAR